MIKIPIDNIGITLVGHLQIERCSNRQFFAFEKKILDAFYLIQFSKLNMKAFMWDDRQTALCHKVSQID